MIGIAMGIRLNEPIEIILDKRDDLSVVSMRLVSSY